MAGYNDLALETFQPANGRVDIFFAQTRETVEVKSFNTYLITIIIKWYL